MDQTRIKIIIEDAVTYLRDKVIPDSESKKVHDFERASALIAGLLNSMNNKQEFKQKLSAFNRWVSDSCEWSDEFLSVINDFNKKVRQEICKST